MALDFCAQLCEVVGTLRVVMKQGSCYQDHGGLKKIVCAVVPPGGFQYIFVALLESYAGRASHFLRSKMIKERFVQGAAKLETRAALPA